MSFDGWKVSQVPKSVAEEVIVTKHYSRRMSIFWKGFGLFDQAGTLEGVVVYGQPSPPIQKHAFVNRDFRLYELSRLVVQTEKRNAASFLISKSLKMLDAPCAVVSYADGEFNHCGFVYQATNWLYTGETVSHDHAYVVDGKRVHPITLRDRGITDPKRWAKQNNVETIKPFGKHRYFTFVGDKRQTKHMRSALRYNVVSAYPKTDPTRYDDGSRIEFNEIYL